MPGANVPFPPMEAELVPELPSGAWQYEPKWDGFRGVLENDGDELALWSRNGRPLLRYFPELAGLGELLPPHSALDGEIVIERDGRLDFDAMQLRLHPAESRIRRLSAETPATYIVFDVLLWDGEEVWQLPLERRRERVEKLEGFRVSPATLEHDLAAEWLETLEAAGLDGVIAKRLGEPYRPGSREAVAKVKQHKTADCVVLGVRWKSEGVLATLLLGLWDGDELRYVGTASVAGKQRAAIEEQVLPLVGAARGFSEPNRWQSKELAASEVRPELVVEVRYDKWQSGRFRHGTRFLRFRPDKDPASCTLAEVVPPRGPDDPTVSGLLDG
ncbi:MAG: ATP-dependent DNA ligase [Gaiellaceae bacterium]